MSKDFEQIERRQGNTFSYDPTSKNQPSPMDGRSGENLLPYYGMALTPQILEEIKTWSALLMALKDGIPKPFDNSIIIDKIIKLEQRTKEDLSYLKQCCPPSADIREAKELKPIIFGILDRIVDISGIKNYVSRYE